MANRNIKRGIVIGAVLISLTVVIAIFLVINSITREAQSVNSFAETKEVNTTITWSESKSEITVPESSNEKVANEQPESTSLFNETNVKEDLPQKLLDELAPESESIVLSQPEIIPEYQGEDYIVLNNNIPKFSEYEIAYYTGEYFSELDALGRCGFAMAMIDSSMMPNEERGSIGMIKPSGWHTVKYPAIIPDLYLYNRCHLIGYSLTGQNDNELNLITGTRYMNISIMPIFEREVVRVLKENDYHVLYRVTPYFKENELVARGVEMEALSIEDQGKSLCFHVFCYNIQPGIEIDYSTGDSWQGEE